MMFENKKRMNENLSSLNDFLDELKNGCGTRKEADALYRKAKETLGKGDFGLFEKEYAQTRNRLSESKKRMNEEVDRELINRLESLLLDLGDLVSERKDDLEELGLFEVCDSAWDSINYKVQSYRGWRV